MAVWSFLLPIALGLAVVQLLVVRNHPEPDEAEPDAEHKPRYAALIGTRMITGCLVMVLAAVTPVVVLPPVVLSFGVRPVWAAWGSCVLVLVAVDARSTWLPARATILAGAAVTCGLLSGALIAPDDAVPMLTRAALGSAAAALLFAALWRLSGSLGFGDVWMAAMLGAMSAATSGSTWYASLFAGTAAAAAWGAITMAWRRRRPSPLGKAFAYGPGLWLGPYLAVGWLGAASSCGG